MIAFKFIIVLFVLAAIATIAFRACIDPQAKKFKRPILALLLLAFFVGSLIALKGVGQVEAGHRGVVLRFGGVTGRVLGEGLYIINPVAESVQQIDVQVHAHKTPATAASRDLQDVQTEITLNYSVDPLKVADVYRSLRLEYESRIVVPAVQEAIKAATAEYDAEQLIQQRVKVRGQMEAGLVARLSQHGLVVDGVAITNFKFSPEFEKAIESKVVAVQSSLKAQNDLVRIKTEAEQRVATAEAEARAIKIQAEAIQSQGGAEYVQLKAIEKWDGKLPQWTSAGTPFINIPAPR